LRCLTRAALSVLYVSVWATPSGPAPTRGGRARRVVLTALLLVAMVGSWEGSLLIRRHEKELNLLFLQAVKTRQSITDLDFDDPMRDIGLTSANHLNAINDIKASQPRTVLRIFSLAAPGYLRAGAFENFSQSQWSTTAAEKKIVPPRPIIPSWRPNRKSSFSSSRDPTRKKKHMAKDGHLAVAG
jgi:hypothetical protein